ncbi:hypothetical protein I6N95_17315 [Vagococcus sp. BWB3-3]|uniref:Uncharacterized protein n=1 Tax=Vagococcus allomyrinae TaxID=2794353 RepID=A0A940SVY7_9ENTE|nr:hypothetical protein [Vagococcus allomyrinae]MBP1042780.1 hypothetical protein [Vagococcus allomyrinae]
MVGGKAKEESGYALIYALGAIILASVIVGAIFLFAMRAFSQVDRVDKFKQSKDVSDYAMQKGTQKIKEVLEDKLSITIAEGKLGNDETVLKGLVSQWVLPEMFEGIKDANIGAEKQFSYEIFYDSTKNKVLKIDPYKLDEGTGAFGWTKDSYKIGDSRTNSQLIFPLTVEVTEKRRDAVTKTKVTANFIYEVQWEQVDVDQTIQGIDTWRNVFYSYYLNESGQYLSADEWLKKMDQLYRFQAGTEKNFDYGSYSSQTSPLYGDLTEQIVDITDGSPLDFTTGDKKIGNLRFAGSFLVEYGPKMKGIGGSQLQTGNVLSLRNSTENPQLVSFIQLDAVKAATGTLIELPVPKSNLILDVKDFQTNNLLINSTFSEASGKSSQGVLFSKGQIQVTNQLEANNFSFAQYATNAVVQDPKGTNWNEFLTGAMVLSGGSLYAGPVNQNGINSSITDSRKIEVTGNFLLTNVLMKNEGGHLEFSYFNGNQPERPSSLTLEGSKTILSVKGLSFIDSVKTTRRKSYSEYPKDFSGKKDSELFTSFYDDETAWNQIVLKSGAKMELGYAGVEPFHLEVAKNSYLSLKVLPENLLFDSRFIEEAVSKGHLKGKVILEPYSQKDSEELRNDLEKKGINVTQVEELSKAKETGIADGQVVIVKPTNTGNKGSSQVINRTFDYVENLVY